jgi:hypothetical protein
MKITEEKKIIKKMRKLIKEKYKKNLEEVSFGINPVKKITGLDALIKDLK